MLAVAAGCFCVNKNVAICSQNKQLCKIEKSCIICIVAAVALQAQICACEELLPNGPGHPLLALKGQFTLSCGLVGTCQSLTGAFFAIGTNFHSCKVLRGWFNWGSFTNLSCKK